MNELLIDTQEYTSVCMIYYSRKNVFRAIAVAELFVLFSIVQLNFITT